MKLQFAIGAFLVLLGAVELWEWLRDREVSWPVTVLGAVVLSVVSNYKRLPIETMLARISGALTEDSDAE
jgi:drug/metabolite transporter superfamily protein YnfA